MLYSELKPMLIDLELIFIIMFHAYVMPTDSDYKIAMQKHVFYSLNLKILPAAYEIEPR